VYWRDGWAWPGMNHMTSSVPSLVLPAIAAAGLGIEYPAYASQASGVAAWIGAAAIVVAAVVSAATEIADQWKRGVVLRPGRFQALRGPSVFFIIPVIDMTLYWIDIRVITTSFKAEFKAEKTVTEDTVPIDVDVVLFGKVVDPRKAALHMADYEAAIGWASQTAMRDVIGKTLLVNMLESRRSISDGLQEIIDERADPWGTTVISAEIRDVLISPALEDAMSMQAPAERKPQARVIQGGSERQVASKFMEAAEIYARDPNAFQLRAMNTLYEGLKQKRGDCNRGEHRSRDHAAWRCCEPDRPGRRTFCQACGPTGRAKICRCCIVEKQRQRFGSWASHETGFGLASWNAVQPRRAHDQGASSQRSPDRYQDIGSDRPTGRMLRYCGTGNQTPDRPEYSGTGRR
jgi:regulator of protease activity HflC (stomatin/prohibitin superfamily)